MSGGHARSAPRARRVSVARMTVRRVLRILVWLAPVAAFVVILAVLKGAGVPLSVPGVVVVVLLLGISRLMIGRSRRRRRRDRPVTRPDRSR